MKSVIAILLTTLTSVMAGGDGPVSHNIYISGGQLSYPYYNFYHGTSGSACNDEDLMPTTSNGGSQQVKIPPNSEIIFGRCNGVTTHPFVFATNGDGNYDSGSVSGSTSKTLNSGVDGTSYEWQCVIHHKNSANPMYGTFLVQADSHDSPSPAPESSPSPSPESSTSTESSPAPAPESSPAPTPAPTPAPESSPAPTPAPTPAPESSTSPSSITFDGNDYVLCSGNIASIIFNGNHNICEVDESTFLDTSSYPANDNCIDGTQREGFHSPSSTAVPVSGLGANEGQTRYFICSAHPGAKFSVSCPSSSSQCSTYAAEGRTYDSSAPVCPNGTIASGDVSSDSSTPYCQCTSCSQIEVYMAAEGEVCDDGNWAQSPPKATCDTFTCPVGFSKTNPDTIECGGETCVPVATDHSVTTGTNYGQGGAELDLHRCCDYNNAAFTYVSHTREENGAWKNAANGGSGCLSDKCYEKSQVHGHKVCNWGSGACKECTYCTDFEATLPARSEFNDADTNCASSCRDYLYLPESDSKRQNFCRWTSCSGCQYCINENTDGYAVKAGCDASCHKRAHMKQKGVASQQDFCRWSMCNQCTACVAENTAGYEVKAGCDASCHKRAYMKQKGVASQQDFCRWSMCNQCDNCVAENTAGYEVKAGCDASCHKRAHMKQKGVASQQDFCRWSMCNQCTACVAENTDGYAEKAGCDASCHKRAYMKQKGVASQQDFCRWSMCNQCTACVAENTDGYEVKTGCDASCHKRAYMKQKGVASQQDFCRWSMCDQCDNCVAENTAGYTEKEGCDASCHKRAYMKQKGVTSQQDFCRWSMCDQCDNCVTENTAGYTEKAGCDASCHKRAYMKQKGVASQQDFCRWSMCNQCDDCVAENSNANQRRLRVTIKSNDEVGDAFMKLTSARLSNDEVNDAFMKLTSARLSNDEVDDSFMKLTSARLSNDEVDDAFMKLTSARLSNDEVDDAFMKLKSARLSNDEVDEAYTKLLK